MSKNLSESSYVLPKIAYELLDDAITYYKIHTNFTNEQLQSLHSMFGNAFLKATELLESAKFVKYQTKDAIRTAYRIRKRDEHYIIFQDINFCNCLTFQRDVIDSNEAITCKHVLAAKLSDATNCITLEMLTDQQFVELLNTEWQDLINFGVIT